MFDTLNGGDERVAFLVEYLVTKGVVSKNAATWINKAGGSLGMKTDFFMKSENKPRIAEIMDRIEYDSYTQIVNENTYCKNCQEKAITDTSNFIAVFRCGKCGSLSKDGYAVDYTKVNDQVNANLNKLSKQ